MSGNRQARIVFGYRHGLAAGMDAFAGKRDPVDDLLQQVIGRLAALQAVAGGRQGVRAPGRIGLHDALQASFQLFYGGQCTHGGALSHLELGQSTCPSL